MWFYEVYGYFSRGLVLSEQAKKMQCMRKSNEEMLMNAPWSWKFTLPLFYLLFLLSLALKWVSETCEKDTMNCAVTKGGDQMQRGVQRNVCTFMCVCMCVGKQTLRKHLWGGQKHWSSQWGFYYEFVCREITPELSAGSLSQGGLAWLEYKEL